MEVRYFLVFFHSLFWINGIVSIQSTNSRIQSKLDLGCPTESYSGVTWSSDNLENNEPISSDPMCLDENKFTIYRECIDQEWSPREAPNCAYRQKNRERLPKGFIDVTYSSNIAIYRTAPQPWNNSCVSFAYYGSMSDYYSLLETSDQNEFFWLPVKRPRKYFPYLITGTFNYGYVTPQFNHLVDAEECLISNFDGSIIQSANCSDIYPEICLHNRAELTKKYGFCDYSEFLTHTVPNNKCFTYLYNPDSNSCDSYFKIRSWNDDEILRDIYDYYGVANCRIQVDPFEGKEEYNFEKYQNNSEIITFSNWDHDVSDRELSGFVTAGLDGRWNFEETFNCAICERSVEILTPQLIFNFNPIQNELEFTYLNIDFAFAGVHPKCYTTSTSGLLSMLSTSLAYMSGYNIQIPNVIENGAEILKSRLITKLVFTFRDYIFVGECWCSMLSFPGYLPIISNVLVTDGRKPEEWVVFALYVNSNFFCNLEYCLIEDPLRNLELSSTALKAKLEILNPLLDIGDVKIMEILDVTVDKVDFLYHVTVILDEDLIQDLLNSFQLTPNEGMLFNYQMNFIHFVTNQLTLSPLYDIPESELCHVFYCVSPIVDDYGVQRIISARIGEKAVIAKLCLNGDFFLNYWECVGKFPFGASWLSTEEKPCETGNIPQHTQELFNIATKSSLTLDDMSQIQKLTTKNLLNPTDLFLIGISLQKFSRTGLEDIQSAKEIQVIPNILTNVLKVSEKVAHLANTGLNASNIILSSYEDIFSSVATRTELIDDDSFFESGVADFKSANVLSFIIDPEIQNVSGVALFRKDILISYHIMYELDFADVDIRYLLSNESLSDLGNDKLLESAMIFSEDLLDSIRESYQDLAENSTEIPLRIVLSIMKNDVLFQPTAPKSSNASAGMVLMASIPRFDIEFSSLFLYFLKMNKRPTADSEFKCGFWKIHSGSGYESEWSNEGCFLIGISQNSLAICGCVHLTSFAFLMTGDRFEVNNLPHHTKALDLITIIGCSLSLISIILIWITAITFRSWRKKKGTKVLLHLSLGIAFQNVLILISNFKDIPMSGKLSCVLFGVCLHYSVLVIFAWMLIAAYFQFLRFVKVFQSSTTRIIMKCCVVGWIVPLLPIAVILSIDFNLYVPTNFISDAALCYPQGNAFFFGVILPVSFIIVIDLCVFGIIIYNIYGRSQTTRNRSQSYQIHMDQLRLVIFLFFLLGFNWIFGIFINLEQKTLVLSYLFCLTASLQGFTLFVYFVILDPNTRSLWINIRKYKMFDRSN